MTKDTLLKSIAETGYNVGFGAKRHFVTYDTYRIVPKLFSIITLIIGVFQLTNIYKTNVSGNLAEWCSFLLIGVGLIALVVDLRSKSLEDYNMVGKELQGLYNRLRLLYNQVKGNQEDRDFSAEIEVLNNIELRFRDISISEQATATHILTNLRFFTETQIDWLDEQLHFSIRDKFPFFHLESFVLYLLLLGLLIWGVCHAIRLFYC